MAEITKVAVAIYAYLFLVGFGLVAFKLALAAPRRSKDYALEVIAIRSTAGGWRSLGAAVASTATTVITLAVGLVVLGFLLVKLHIAVYGLFVGIVAVITYQTLNLVDFRDRLLARFGERTQQAIQIAVTLVAGGFWLTGSWLAYDLTAMLLIFNFTHDVGVVKLRNVLILCAMLVVFDIWGVWLSQLTLLLATGGTGGHPLPMLVMVPSSLVPWSNVYLAALGLGDIFVGAIIVLAFTPYQLEWWAAAGWCVGLALALLLPFSWVPALLTLVPCIFAVAGIGWLVRRRRGQRRMEEYDAAELR